METSAQKYKNFQFSPEMYENLFENFLDMICIKGFDGYFKKINQRFCDVLGYSKFEVLSRPILELLHPDDHSSFRNELQQLEKGIPILSFDNRFLAKDKTYRWLEWSCLPVPGENVAFAVARDVTAKREGQEAFLETILDNIPDMIFVKDAVDLRFVRFNKAGEELLGYNREDLVGKNDADFFIPAQAEHFIREDHKVLNGGRMIEIPEETISTRFKGDRILHTKKIPVLDSEGRPKYLIGISEDITDKKEVARSQQKIFEEQVARIEVEKSLRERDEFISITSHELKSPLSALKLQAQIFKRKAKSGSPDAFNPERLQKLMDLTESQVLRMDRLVNDMLDVSRIRSGKLAIEKSRVNLIEMVSEVLQKMRNDFEKVQLQVPVLTNPDSDVYCFCDRMRMEQVVQNLLTNAIRYGNKNPVELSVSRKASEALIKVRDKGIGIAADNQNKIFDRFERAIERNEVSGLGLGLFISKQIVVAHSGKIWVESVLGRGSTFCVELPLET